MLTSHKLQFRDLSLSREQSSALERPVRMTMRTRLNSLGTLTLEYPVAYDSQVFSESSGQKMPVIPQAMRLIVRNEDQKSGDEFTYFRGVLDSYEIDLLSQKRLLITYCDPLITAYEIDQTYRWKDTSFKAIVQQIFQNAYAEQSGKSVSVLLRDSEDVVIKNTTNLGYTDLEFVKKTCEDYGYVFFFDHRSDDEEKIVFFAPNFSQVAKTKIEQPTLDRRYRFLSRSNRFLDQVEVHGYGEATAREVAASLKDSSRSFEKRFESRSRLGLELVSHLYRPDLVGAEIAAMAKARLMQAALEGEELDFVSRELVCLGDLIEILPGKDDHRENTRIHGNYLICEVTSSFSGSEWIHQYKGVRP